MVEHVYPPNGDQVLRQSEIGVDLGPGYEGDLVVNGQPIPEEELRRVPEQNQVFYLPGQGTTFEELPRGTHCVTAIAARSATGRRSREPPILQLSEAPYAALAVGDPRGCGGCPSRTRSSTCPARGPPSRSSPGARTA